MQSIMISQLTNKCINEHLRRGIKVVEQEIQTIIGLKNGYKAHNN